MSSSVMLLSRLLVQLVIEFLVSIHLNPTVVKGKFLAIIHSLAKIYGETRNKLATLLCNQERSSSKTMSPTNLF